MVYRLAALGLVLTILLVACAPTQERTNDAAPLPEDVPAEPDAAVLATPAPAAEVGDTGAGDEAEVNPVVDFTISGGIAAFCDSLIVNSDGSYLFESCQGNASSGMLDQSDRISMQTWYENLTSFQLRTEDNPGGPDNMTTELSFAGVGQTEANERQQQVIYDWVSGLTVRLRPKPQAANGAPTPVASNPTGLCPEIERPALMLVDFESPATITLTNIDSQASCDVTLGQAPFGRIASAAGSIFYPIGDSESKTATVWEFTANGEQRPLEFTTVTMDEPLPYDFVVSADGAKIAWGHTTFDLEPDPPIFTNYLYTANIDGSNQLTILDGVENNELRVISPIRFSIADNSTLYYALQPDFGGPIFSGRYDTLYRLPANQTEAELLYACPVEDNPLCISGLAQDGSVLAVLDPTQDAVQVLRSDGSSLTQIPLPATDYVERASFNRAGDLAFVSATLTEPESDEEAPLPNPGYITYLAAPYDADARQILSDNSVSTLWGWLDETRLVYGAIDPAGEIKTNLVTLDGQVSDLSTKFAVGVLR